MNMISRGTSLRTDDFNNDADVNWLSVFAIPLLKTKDF